MGETGVNMKHEITCDDCNTAPALYFLYASGVHLCENCAHESNHADHED